MNARTCVACRTSYSTGDKLLCPSCMGEVSAAEKYRKRLEAGDRSVVPTSDADRLIKKRAIRKSLNGSPDCSYIPERKPSNG